MSNPLPTELHDLQELRDHPEKGGSVYKHYLAAAVDLAAGTAGGAATVAVGQPLDTVKVKMQSFPELYPGSVGCFSKTFAQDGVRGLYAGTLPALVANVAENSVLFCAYGLCQKLVQRAAQVGRVQELNPLHNACAGFLAAFFSSLALCPTELVKCRLQALRESGQGAVSSWQLCRDIYRRLGPKGFFKGFTPTVAREMPGYFFFFGGYEGARHFLTPPGKTKDDIGVGRTIVSGGVGGVCLWISIFPADVVKSRIQITGSNEPALSVARHIVRTEGVRALYNGLGPTLLRTFPSTGALFLAYEYTRRVLNRALDIED
ncbi:carnitine-acylcarnitine carrier protein, putative [Ixodes scapularis]|uniref:Carnitine-acylcarnitine carrier protein, putative n=1 Tax=Ixodes scapularis TaxID=6945 RepID=B7PGP7_IXOSC|nr:carnitine-acylcarnitine carrier protein, putative [Ixodes scapularis]|eukprot:XP_002401227.1 carnitine-acylcarnitine carrier protein, putative [Ixodes scapularis]